MSSSLFSKRVSRFFRKRHVRERWCRVSDPRHARGRRWGLARGLETGFGALVLQLRRCHRLDERPRTGLARRGGELRLAPMPAATVPWLLPQVDRSDVRQVLGESVRAEVQRKRVVTPAGAMRTRAIDGQWLWRGRRGGCPDCQVQGPVRGHRGLRAWLTRTRPRVLLDPRTLAADANEMGACAAFWAQRLQA